MILLGYGEKISSTKISDFEYFDLWERVLPLAEGHKAVKNYEKELSRIGFFLPKEPYSRERSIRRWRELNSLIYGDITDDRPEVRVTDNNIKNIRDKSENNSYFIYDLTENITKFATLSSDITRISQTICDDIKMVKEDCITIRTNVLGGEYIRPTPYLAETIFNKRSSGDILSSSDKNALNFQLLILTLLGISGVKKVTLELFGNTENALEFVSYLGRRGLFCGEVRIEFGREENVSNFTTAVLENYPNIYIRPMLTGEIQESTLDLYRSEYPISAFYLLTKI